MTMGRDRLVDKTIHPFTTLTSLTPASVISNASTAGVIPVGNYKGAAAFWDLDKANNQPLVAAEQLHILENIDGAGVNGLAAIAVGAVAIGVVTTGTITVPAGETWFINCVTGTCVADATGTLVYNWRCSLFPDLLGNVLGGAYHTANLATPLAPQLDEFGPIATVFGVGNKPVLLRLPAGTTISGQVTNTLVVATGVAATFQLFGFVGRTLVA